jgi:hypothetical protein
VRTLIAAQNDGGFEILPAGVASPMMADFTTIDEFRRFRCHHLVVATWAAHRRKGWQNHGIFGSVILESHDPFSSEFPVAPWLFRHRGNPKTAS